ncbi:MAG: hypothetical protein ACXVAY_23150 [Mucilaginibacter sp.]
MKNLIKISTATLLFYVCFFTSCAAFRGMDTTKLELGMDKQTAYKALMVKPDNVIIVKQYPAGTLEVVGYTPVLVQASTNTIPNNDNHDYRQRPGGLWLYFFNNKLVQYGRPGNLEEESEHIVSMQTH